ncbi:uncharacterized protein LOC114370087 [Glycine soja]|uniref:uncharacterized protein LOC114370087 n=1 Tax=Glycine soja TaxID=3848 RepID=UPI00103FC1D3|nr:uncharacterized protein LOC114370087 [Glycine soja]
MPTTLDVVKNEVMKLLAVGIIYPISNSTWVSPVQVVPKKLGITVVKNQDDELILTRVAYSWRVCIDYRRLNQETRKDHFARPFINQVLERLAGFYRRFIQDFSNIFVPLSKLLQKDVDFVLDQPYREAFEELRRKLTTSPIM